MPICSSKPVQLQSVASHPEWICSYHWTVMHQTLWGVNILLLAHHYTEGGNLYGRWFPSLEEFWFHWCRLQAPCDLGLHQPGILWMEHGLRNTDKVVWANVATDIIFKIHTLDCWRVSCMRGESNDLSGLEILIALIKIRYILIYRLPDTMYWILVLHRFFFGLKCRATPRVALGADYTTQDAGKPTTNGQLERERRAEWRSWIDACTTAAAR